MSDIFNQSQDNQNVAPSANPLENLVGEGKKFKSVEDLAKGKLESDAFIASMKSELDAVKQELAKRSTAEELLEQIKREALTRNSETPVQREPAVQGETIDPNKIFEIAKQAYSQERAAETKSQNVDRVKNKLIEAYGADYVPALKAKLQSLSLSESAAADLAAENPQAFLNIVVGQQASDRYTNVVPPRSSMSNFAPSMPEDSVKFKEAMKTRAYRDQNYQLDLHRRSIEAGRSVLD